MDEPDVARVAVTPPPETTPSDETNVVLSTKRGIVAIGRDRFNTSKSWVERTFEKYRHRVLVDLGLRLYERDRDSAGTVVSSAIAFRLFMFFVPMLLFSVGILGFFAEHISADDVTDAGVTGSLAQQINNALSQPNTTRWFAVLFGLFGMATTGRTLSRALTQASCLAWRLPVRPKATAKVVGAIIGLIFSVALVTALVTRIRAHVGMAAAGMSFVIALGVYLVAFLVLLALLPRPNKDLGALLPGAAIVAVTLVGMQAVSQLYLPDKFNRMSELYGAIGVTIVTLGWFFIAGRVIMLALVLNAVLWERFGSITQFVFSLPVLRLLPRHSKFLRKRFGLEDSPIAGGTAPPAQETGAVGGDEVDPRGLAPDVTIPDADVPAEATVSEPS